MTLAASKRHQSEIAKSLNTTDATEQQRQRQQQRQRHAMLPSMRLSWIRNVSVRYFAVAATSSTAVASELRAS